MANEMTEFWGEPISVYTDQQAVEDGTLVALNQKDRVTRPVFEYFCKKTPTDPKPPDHWPVDMFGWFRAGTYTKKQRMEAAAKHGKDADTYLEDQARMQRAAALAGGLIGTHAQRARTVYEQNLNGGIFVLFAVVGADGKLLALAENPPKAEFTNGAVEENRKLWLLPNECGGVTLMFPEDY